jgi:RNA polymerase sigma-70 factor (ECF subfamily)
VLGAASDAADAVQVASERAWRGIVAVDPERGFRSWFLRIVANTARNQRRALGRRRRAELRVAARRASVDDTHDGAVTASERAAVVAALNRLGSEERLVIALRHFEQLTEREMADVLDCPPGTVKSRLSRAMTRLRAELPREAFDAG